jgi:hypothetical protein
MATRRERSILVGEMVVGAYKERHPFICRLRGQRCAIERLGVGWLLLFPFLTSHPMKATLPSPPPNPSRASALRVAVSCQAMSGGRALVKRDVPFRKGRDG